jgi:hypothetical protein
MWAWLLVPGAVGLFALGWPSLPSWLFLSGVVLGFFLRASMETWRLSRPRELRFLMWAVILGIGMHLTVVPPITHWGRWVLVPLTPGILLGPISVQAVRQLRVQWRILGEGLVVASMALLATALAYASTGDVDKSTGFLWLPVVLYFWGGIIYVRMSLAPAANALLKHERRRTVALYHAGLLLALAGAVSGGAMPALAALAYAPMMAKTLAGLLFDLHPRQVRQLGILEAVHAALFGVLLIALYRLEL